jgi:hypothetical protein
MQIIHVRFWLSYSNLFACFKPSGNFMPPLVPGGAGDFAQLPGANLPIPKGPTIPNPSAPKYKKAPDAPKRFKSAFIIFSAEKHKEIKSEMAKQGRTEKVRIWSLQSPFYGGLAQALNH